MEPRTRMLKLGDFADLANDSLSKRPPPDEARPFNNAKAQDPPMLRPKGMNRILIFPGAFNPPHQGHLDLLNHVFENAGLNMFLSGAIIVPLDDDEVEKKQKEEEKPFILSQEQRVELWRDVNLPDKYWVFDKDKGDFHRFLKNLTKEIHSRLPEVELDFMLLAGPDWIRPDFLASAAQWGCTDMITSDVSRPVQFRRESMSLDMSLDRILRCEPWERTPYDIERLNRHLHARMNKSSHAERIEAAKAAHETILNVWRCRRECQPRGWVRFIPVDLDQQPKQPPTSTRLREIIGMFPDRYLEPALRDMALSPALLAQFARPWRAATTVVVNPSSLIRTQDECSKVH